MNITTGAPRIVKLGPPSIISDFSRVPYKVLGWPRPTRFWMQNGEKLRTHSVIYDHEFKCQSGYKNDTVCGALILEIASHVYNGNYTLFVANPLGNDSATLPVIFMDPPSGSSLVYIIIGRVI